MIADRLPPIVVDGQLLAAGFAVHLTIQHLLQYRLNRARYCLWMGIWSLTMALTLISNQWAVEAPRWNAVVAFQVRGYVASFAFLALVPTAYAFANARIPRAPMLAVVGLISVRLVLLPCTNLILLHSLGADGTSRPGPLDSYIWMPAIVLGVGLAVHALTKWDDPLERSVYAVGLTGTTALGVLAVFSTGPWGEILSGYWMLPPIVTLLLVSSRRIASAEVRQIELLDAQQRVVSELSEMELRSRLALKAGGLGLFEYSSSGSLVVSDELVEMLGVTSDQVHDQGLAFLEIATESGLAPLVLCALRDGTATAEHLIERVDGRPIWLALMAMAVDSGPTGRRVIGVGKDITRRKADQALLESRAYHDDLTGLPNRAALLGRIAELLEGEARFALLVLDLDNFKDINDTMGHGIGDDVLAAVARRLIEHLPAHAFLARLGGDEFAVILSKPEGAGDHVARALAVPIDLGTVAFNVRASVGVAVGPDDGDDPATLLRRADSAMYRAKLVRGSWCGFEPNDESDSARRLRLAADLPGALRNEQFDVHFQPSMWVDRRRVRTVEALARWRHPEFGPVPPSEFIPLAENHGLGMPLTRRVLRESLTACKRWREMGLAERVAVNASPRTLVAPGFLALVDSALSEHGLPPSALGIELTEDACADDSPELRRVLTGLRDRGIGIGLDDFGTGYSSLSYIGRLPIEAIKLDKSFIRGLDDDPTAQAVALSTIELAHRLNLTIVAEGVESEATFDLLCAHGCDVVQGYWLCPPLPASQLQQWLVSHRATVTRENGSPS